MWASSQVGGHDRRPVRLVLPFLLIVVGTLFLLNNLGVVPWSVWLTLARLWPVILILFGLDLLLGRRGGMLRVAITAIVVVAVVAIAVGLTVGNTSQASATQGAEGRPDAAQAPPRTLNVPLGSASSGDVTLRFPAGTLAVGALPAKGENLLQATTTMPLGMRLSKDGSLRDGVNQIILSASGDRSMGSFLPPGWPFGGSGSRGSSLAWNVQFAPSTPLSLRTDVGAGQLDFDLTNLMVQNFTLNSGAGDITIHFPANAGQTIADVHSGAGQLDLIVPPGVGAYVHTSQGAIVNVHVPADRFHQVSDGYQTADYSTATNRVDVTLHLGVGSVDVQ